MRQLLLLARGRTSFVYSNVKWTRSFAHKAAQSENRTNSHEQQSAPRGPEGHVHIDPFGLEYLGLDTIVQGLYSKPEESAVVVNGTKTTATAAAEEKYKDWFLEKKPNQVDLDSELVRTTTFGSIRLDSDNSAKVLDDDEYDYERESRNTRFGRQRESKEKPFGRQQNYKLPPPLPRDTGKETRDAFQNERTETRTLRRERDVVTRDNYPTSQNYESAIPPNRSSPIDRSSNETKTGNSEPENVEVQNSKPKRNMDFTKSTTKRQTVSIETPENSPKDTSKLKENVVSSPRALRPSSDISNRNPTTQSAQWKSMIKESQTDKFVPPVVDPLPDYKSKFDKKADDKKDHVVRNVPAIYEQQDYNRITHTDMWAVLKHCIVYQNDFLIALNKPHGLPMHSPSRDCRHTLIEFLDELAQASKCEKVYPLHRLDKETTGVLLLAKSEQAAEIIKKKFKDRQIGKLYLTITKTCPHVPRGAINIPISEGKIGGTDKRRAVLKPDLTDFNIATKQSFAKEAVTNFKVLASDEECAFVEITTETGVTHQVRVHLSMGLGCPILGDHKYSHREKLAPQRLSPAILNRLKVSQSKVRNLPLHLHCSQVRFTMPKSFAPTSEPVFITARPPNFFMHTLKMLHLI